MVRSDAEVFTDGFHHEGVPMCRVHLERVRTVVLRRETTIPAELLAVARTVVTAQARMLIK